MYKIYTMGNTEKGGILHRFYKRKKNKNFFEKSIDNRYPKWYNGQAVARER